MNDHFFAVKTDNNPVQINLYMRNSPLGHIKLLVMGEDIYFQNTKKLIVAYHPLIPINYE